MSLENVRREYAHMVLHEHDLDPDPIEQFGAWYRDVEEVSLHEATAMTLATTDREGHPSARIVLLKGFDERGFVFYTNYNSQKGRELVENPHAALLCYWSNFDRQVRVRGSATKLSHEESSQYFRTRPRGAQIGAWASEQSRAVASRDALERSFADIDKKFRNQDVPCPSHWGGFRVAPVSIEFWQGRENRLHDRFRYSRQGDGDWAIERLAP